MSWPGQCAGQGVSRDTFLCQMDVAGFIRDLSSACVAQRMLILACFEHWNLPATMKFTLIERLPEFVQEGFQAFVFFWQEPA